MEDEEKNIIRFDYTSEEDVSKIVDAIENSGCIIINPNYNPVRGMDNGLILRSADRGWLIENVMQILEMAKKGD
tara:strand:- start:1271 stop:1492 length:222 start_codon:yes stop_codon:yes gene_type:complete